MTSKELNRDIKRLYNRFLEIRNESGNKYWERVANEIEPEFKRLYFADREFTCFNKNSIIILIRLNLLFRIIPLHQFGLFIKLEGM